MMKSRFARLGVLLAAVVGLMATMTPPASATTVKVVVFQGEATLDKGLGYPCTPTKIAQGGCPPEFNTTTKTGPHGEPMVNITPKNGLHTGFDFSSAQCVKLSISTPNKATPKNGVDLCSLTATGVVWGWCGLSQGMGTALLENLTSGKAKIDTTFKFTGVGGLLYVTGENPGTNATLYGVVAAVPEPSAPGGPSCTNKTGTTFLLAGVALIVIPN